MRRFEWSCRCCISSRKTDGRLEGERVGKNTVVGIMRTHTKSLVNGERLFSLSTYSSWEGQRRWTVGGDRGEWGVEREEDKSIE
jgi:hypothetical protein